MDQDFPNRGIIETNENYLSEDSWEKFWAIHGERLIWASWIKNYSDYINPAFLDESNELAFDENSIPKQHSVDQIYKEQININQKLIDEDNSMRERKFSYDSKVNPYKKFRNQNTGDKNDKNFVPNFNKDNIFIPIGRRRSCSEHDRMLSPRTLAGTDSMTNVTKITLSSYDVNSSHVTSESSPTDDYSVSSSTSDDQSNDQTRIANIDEIIDQVPSEELEPDQYWQLLWKKHFGEQYALHYANYIESSETQSKNVSAINIKKLPKVKTEEKITDIEYENSEGNSQEMPSVIEIQNQVEDMKIEEKEEKVTKPKKRSKKASNKYIGSVGVLLQNLLKEEQRKKENEEVVEAGEGGGDKGEPVKEDIVDGTTSTSNVQQAVANTNLTGFSYNNDGDDEPPEENAVTMKRRYLYYFILYLIKLIYLIIINLEKKLNLSIICVIIL